MAVFSQIYNKNSEQQKNRSKCQKVRFHKKSCIDIFQVADNPATAIAKGVSGMKWH